MKHSIRKVLIGTAVAAGFISTVVLAEQYNHGNHNDPQYTWAEGGVQTFSCGSSALSTCISGVNLTNITAQACRNMVTDDTDGALPWGQAYYHTVQSYAVHVMSAIDNNYGSGANAYTVDVKFSCSGLLHPGIKQYPSSK